MQNVTNIFFIFLKLGLTSFGGPVAHLAYFRHEFVQQRKWFSEEGYSNIVALCQFLPGPASSQVGMIVGLSQAGYGGLLAAWIGFTLPSALLLMAFAMSLNYFEQVIGAGVLHGLKIVALVVVIQAVWSMGKSLCPDRPRMSLMAVSACVVLLFPLVGTQVAVLLCAAVIGMLLFRATSQPQEIVSITTYLPNKRLAVMNLVLFASLLVSLPFLANWFDDDLLSLADIFYRAGALVFGGGHVVLPLLQAEVVPELLSNERFLAGYGAAQAVPGPLFTFSAFLGSSIGSVSGSESLQESVWLGVFSVVVIFLPSFLLVMGVLPFWQTAQKSTKMQSALLGVNAAVVGILLAALFDPIWINSIQKVEDFVFALVIFTMLFFWRLPVWLVVVIGGILGGIANFMAFA
ncbi:chromate efflux transporter [Marinomonas agarivorans]|nr:chromate efflux transporter [Marinomonas agarivorans]